MFLENIEKAFLLFIFKNFFLTEKIVVNFTDFKYNETIDESVFLPMGEKEE